MVGGGEKRGKVRKGRGRGGKGEIGDEIGFGDGIRGTGDKRGKRESAVSAN